MKVTKLLLILALSLLTLNLLGACSSSSDDDDDASACVDVDGDGYTAESCGGDDCDDSNSLIHPGASDIEGDGVDADCDGTDAQGETGDDDDDDDSEVPEIVSLTAQVQSVSTFYVQLAEDEMKEKIIPSQAQVTFTTRVEDNITDEENLVLAVLDITDGGSTAVTLLSSEFASGLWSVAFTGELGHEYTLTVADEAENLLEFSGSLYFPTREEAIVDDWTIHYFYADTSSKFVYNATFDDDGTFTEEKSSAASDYRSGSWSLTGTTLDYSWEEANNVEVSPSDPVPGVDYMVKADVYVDSVYMMIAPWTRSGGGSGLDGTTWTRYLDYYRLTIDTTGWYLAESRNETWTLATRNASNIGVWSEVVTGTEYDEAGDVVGPINDTRSGTWQVIVNSDYVNSMDDFLKLEVTNVNGTDQAAQAIVDLHTVRDNLLLVRQYVRE